MAGKAAGEAATAAGASSSLRATLNIRNVGASWGGDGKKLKPPGALLKPRLPPRLTLFSARLENINIRIYIKIHINDRVSVSVCMHCSVHCVHDGSKTAKTRSPEPGAA